MTKNYVTLQGHGVAGCRVPVAVTELAHATEERPVDPEEQIQQNYIHSLFGIIIFFHGVTNVKIRLKFLTGCNDATI